MCSTDNLDDWVLNNNDEDDNCYSNYHDCAGICDGDAVYQTYWNDDDGDGFGNGIVQDFCSNENLDGWVLNSDDIDDNCYSNIFDCAGICDGPGQIQEYWFDDDNDGLGFGESIFLCSNDIPPPGSQGWVLNNYDIDDSCFSNDIDSCGICDGDNLSCSGCNDVTAFNFNCYESEMPPCNNDIIINDGSCIYSPDEFIFTQSQMQAFYIVENVEVKLDQIEELELYKDWIGVFKDSVCVGSYPWIGDLTTIPAMGNDGSGLTQNYLETGDYPTFHIYDSSEKIYLNTDVSISSLTGSEYEGWGNFEFFWIEDMFGRGPDCSGMELGSAFLDDCGICVCGYLESDETVFGCYEGTPNENLDCDGVCEPSTPLGAQHQYEGLSYGAILDDCGVCFGGSTGNIENSDDAGCGCFNEGPKSYWVDIDQDGFGFGEDPVALCQNDVTDFYSNNNLDNEPSCPNLDPATLMIDGCGDCVGVDVDDFDANMDDLGVCCEQSLTDSCGICFGDDSLCNKPVVDNLDLETDEDTALNIILIGSDPNQDSISFIIIDEPYYGMITGVGQNLIYTPNLDYNGIDSFTFKASDASWNSDLGIVNINILPINDEPIANDIEVIAWEDSTIIFNLSAFDVDLDDLVYSLVSYPLNGSASLANNQIIYTPESNYNGSDSFSFIVSDSELTSNEANIDILISDVPDEPYLLEIPDASINEGEAYTYEMNFGDDDNDILSFFIQANNSTSSVIDGSLFVTPTSNFVGSIAVSVTISDGVYNVNQTFILEVLPINDPPYLLPITDQTMLEDEVLVLEVISSDPDGDDVVIEADSILNASIIVQNNIITLTPENNFNGILDVIIYASDLEFSVSTSFSVNVLPVNDPPQIINIIEDIVVFENSNSIEINLSEIFYDVENQNNLNYSISENIDALLTNIEDSILTLSFLNEVSGSGVVDITASDNIDRAIVSTSFSVEIISVNNPPFIDMLSLELDEDNELDILLNASDPEDDLLSYSIVNYPSNGSLSFISENEYVYIPDQDYFGLDSFIFQVSDGEYEVQSSVDILINALNDAPYFITTSLSEGAEGFPYESIIEIGDIDNLENELLLSLASGPNWLTIEGTALIGSPHSTSASTYSINLELSDGEDISVTTLFLKIESTISAPFVQDLSVNLLEDSSTEILLNASGTIDSILTYNVVTSPLNGSLSGIPPNLVYTPNMNFSGTDNMIYNAANGFILSEEASITFNVIPVNDPPIATDFTVDINTAPYIVDFNESISDLDNDELILITLPSSENEILSTLLGGTLTPVGNLIYEYSPPETAPESDFLLYKVSDGVVTSNLSILTLNLFGRSWTRFNPPIAFDDEATFFENQITELSFAGFDVFYDFPLNGTESVNIIDAPQHGTLSQISLSESSTNQLAVWNVNYIPDLDYEGTDTIRYNVSNPSNSNGDSNEGTIAITINGIDELPQIDIVSNISLNEDVITEIPFNAFDDSDLNLSVSSSNNLINAVIINDSTISIIPESNISGSSLVSLTAQEIGGFQRDVTAVINVNVLAVNDPPILEYVGDITIGEDEIITLSLAADDIDYVSLDFNLVIESENLSTSIVNNIMTLSGIPNYFGQETISVMVTDNEGLSDSQEINFTILPINDKPIMADFNPIKIVEDSLTVIFPNVSDVDNSDLVIFAENSENISVTVFDEDDDRHGAILIIPNSDWNGIENIAVTVSDGEFDVSKNLTVNVESINDPPKLNSISNQEIDEDNSIDLALSISNEEGDFLIYSVIHDGGMFTSISNNILSITPPMNYFGDTNITVEVSDSEFTDITSFNLKVNSINDSPVLTQLIDDVVLIEDTDSSVILLNSYFSDVDEDNLVYNVELNSNEIIQANIVNDKLTISNIENKFGGPIIATVTASDQISNNIATDSFEINIIGVNDAPSISHIDNPQIQEDGIFIYSLEGFDSDGDELIFAAEIDSSLGSLSINGNLLSIVPISNFNGHIDVLTFVSDTFISDSTTFTITVNPVNDPPLVLNPQLDITLPEDSETLTIGLDSIFYDIDSDSLSYEINITSESIVSLDIVSDDLIISFIKDQFGGPIPISLRATDGEGLSSNYNNFSIVITPVNDIPEIISSPVLIASEDSEYIYEVKIEDVDSDVFYYNLSTFPIGMTIDTTNGIIKWTPEQGVFSSGLINLYVWDNPSQSFGVDAPAYQEFTIDVVAVNDAPVIISSPPLTAIENSLYSYQVLVLDPDDNEFTYSLSNQPEGMNIDSNGLITWIPINGTQTSGNVKIFVSDGGEDGAMPYEQDLFIVVIAVNDPPIIVSIPEILELMELDTFFYQIVVEDIDDDTFSYVLHGAPEGMTVNTDGLIHWIPQYQGNYGPITILVSDGGGADSEPAMQEFFITVNPLSSLINYCLEFQRPEGANLKSFYALPEDTSIENVLFSLQDKATGVITEGSAAFQISDGVWVGSLETIEPHKGYWIIVENNGFLCLEDAIPLDPTIIYELKEGANLISFPQAASVGISNGLPDNIENSITGIITQGNATYQISPGEWVGSLSSFDGGMGYWFITTANFSFSYELELLTRTSQSHEEATTYSDQYFFDQSTRQAFYFIENIIVDGVPISTQDWILVYHGETLVGSRKWNGYYTDIPAMGFDDRSETYNYSDNGSSLTLKVLKSNGVISSIKNNLPTWEDY